jgi:vitamin B12 transport system substrate-binding protein
MMTLTAKWQQIMAALFLFVFSVNANEAQQNHSTLRIVSLAPHLTEWVYSLHLESHLVAVSAYSDYPEQAKLLPRVADYQGADIAKIMALSPTLILAWEGGNKPSDINKLERMGYQVFKSNINELFDIPRELKALGKITDREDIARALASQFEQQLMTLKNNYKRTERLPVFYYFWTTPLMSIGPHAWPNKLLNVCGAQTMFEDSPVDYPQVSIKEVLLRQPKILVASSKASSEELNTFWAPHSDFIDAPLITVNPDITSRFTLRMADELKTLCDGINNRF